MAQGDVVFFDQALVDILEGFHDLETGTFNLCLITDAVTPAATTADPRWGAGGTTNYATNESTPGGNYSTGGLSIANPAVTLTGGLAMFDGDDVSMAQNASNPTNCRWGLIRNTANNRLLGFVDLGSPTFDATTGPLAVNWNANGIARLDN